MHPQKQGKWPANPAAPAMTRNELRQRILAVVHERRRVGEVELWRAYAPGFLPWEAMVAELIALAQEQQLRREVVAPGNIVIHAVENLSAKKPPTKARKQPTTRTTALTKKSR